MSSQTESQVFLITGGSRGIGLGVTEVLLQQGQQVVSFSRSLTPELSSLQESHPGKLFVLQGDLTSNEACANAVSKTIAHFGRLDGVVLNAASGGPFARVLDVRDEDVLSTLATNVLSAYAIVRASIPELRKSRREGRGGRVAVVSSVVVGGGAGISVYCASKAALNTFVASVAQEEPDITFVAIDPGVVDTKMSKAYREEGGKVMTPEMHGWLVAVHAENKLTTPIQVGASIAAVALHAPQTMSGKFVVWNSDEVNALMEAK
ncbi:NAD(P)-binding protein [Auriculariales sp. MPI-PUGE-AT-0066]|nr:NAD(P)-binding protein [Auriculariales sp. MPI-PUGE-AT-0066]